MAGKPLKKIDFVALQETLLGQFRGLDPKDPSMWPAVPRYCAFAAVIIAVVAGLWFAWLSDSELELQAEQAKEVKLRVDFKARLAKAVNLDVLKKQREQVLQYVTQLEKQLPSKAEMDALLSDINQALQFELFRPGQVLVRDYYAELPISIRVTGKYHDIGSFASDIANLSRIVTLNNLSLAPRADSLVMEATAKTFRYLDAVEVEAQRKVGAKK